jgi:hypothetical protein
MCNLGMDSGIHHLHVDSTTTVLSQKWHCQQNMIITCASPVASPAPHYWPHLLQWVACQHISTACKLSPLFSNGQPPLTFCRWSCLQIHRTNKHKQMETISASCLQLSSMIADASFPSKMKVQSCLL